MSGLHTRSARPSRSWLQAMICVSRLLVQKERMTNITTKKHMKTPILPSTSRCKNHMVQSMQGWRTWAGSISLKLGFLLPTSLRLLDLAGLQGHVHPQLRWASPNPLLLNIVSPKPSPATVLIDALRPTLLPLDAEQGSKVTETRLCPPSLLLRRISALQNPIVLSPRFFRMGPSSRLSNITTTILVWVIRLRPSSHQNFKFFTKQ